MTVPGQPSSWVVTHQRIPEAREPGLHRLGRHIRHDSRNLYYAHRASGRALTSQLWPRNIPILDQGEVGSCTGNAQVGALGTGPLWDALPSQYKSVTYLTEALALKIYSAAETIDGDGPYPPNDNGSSGPSAAQAAKAMGLISGYTHAFDLASVLDALEDGPVGIGANWYSSFDTPDSTGLVAISGGAYVRGGHEFLCRGKDVDKQLLYFDNSWGVTWGNKGSFSMSYATLTRLLAEQGDATVSLPLSAPVPVPVPPQPVPPQPVPVPVPTPTPGPGADQADQALELATRHWRAERHTGDNKKAASAVRAWVTAKGLG